MSQPPYEDLKVLLVGDSKTLSNILRDFLVSIGFTPSRVHCLQSGIEALTLLESVQVDLVISNLSLGPPIHGLAFLEKIRSHSNATVSALPFLLLTGDLSPALRDRALRHGVSGFITKPFQLKGLQQTIESVLKISRESRASGAKKTPKDALSPEALESRSCMRNRTILIVDDSPVNRAILKSLMKNEKCSFVEAQSGEEALQILKGPLPDLILMDVVMGGMNGYEACRKIKTNPRTVHIPLIFITGRDQKRDILNGLAVGGNDYITKPFVPEEVVMRIRTQMRLVRMLVDKESLIQELTSLKEKNEHLIVELLTLKENLEQQALTDPLTGLTNRRGMQEKLSQEFGRTQRGARSFSLVMGDLDHFKQINDTYGHPGGDQVLIQVAKLLTSSLRKTDALARWGGEEFLILFPETSQQGALVAAEILREKVQNHSFTFQSRPSPVTLSLGVTEFDPSGMTVDQCIQQADHALYQAKMGGRNKTVVHSSMTVA